MDQSENIPAESPPGGRRRKSLPATLAALALVVSIAALGVAIRAETRGISVASTVPNVGIVEKDFAIQAPIPAVRGGQVDLTVANAGPSAHEFLIFRTDLPADQLPLKEGRVDEDSRQITKVFDSETNIDPNAAKTFHATLTPGRYVLVCNLAPNHYVAGMHTAFTVT